MAMKISNFAGTADTFTWAYNPQVYDSQYSSNHEITNISFQKHHILISGAGAMPKAIVLTGHFSGSSKRTYYESLSKHFAQTTQLKKLYFESDKFCLGIGKDIKQTNAGGRTNFIDYVAAFEGVIGMLFGDTLRTSGTNEGNITTFVESITGTVTSGASDVTLTDGTTTLTIPASALTTGQAIVYNVVKMVDSGSGIYVSEYAYMSIAGTQTKLVQATGGFGILKLAAGINVSTISTTNLGTVVKSFRDGWAD